MAVFYPRCRIQLTVIFDGRGGIGPADDIGPFTINVWPRTCSVMRNGYHEADTWNCTFDQRVLPFDPDQIKQAEARVYMWDSQGDDSPNYNFAIDRNEMIRGLVDDDDGVMVGEDNVVKLSGRDYTGVLIDALWDPKEKIPPALPLDELIQFVADKAAPTTSRAHFAVVNKTDREMTPATGLIGKKRSTRAKGEWVKPGKNHWDIIYDLAISNGFIAYVDMQSFDGEPLRPTIIITDPATQTKETLRQAPRLVYGRHLSKLNVKRKFGREKTPQQILVTHDPKTKQEITVTYPEQRNTVVTAFGTPIATMKDEQEFVPAPKGIFDRDLLLKYAKLRFFYRGRAETSYTFETAFLSLSKEEEQLINVDTSSEFWQRNGGNLLSLRPGSAIGIAFDPFNREHLRRLTPGERVEHIVEQGYHADVAHAVAENLETLTAFEQPYYLKTGQFDFDVDEGLTIKIEAVNFAHALREETLAAQSDQQAWIA